MILILGKDKLSYRTKEEFKKNQLKYELIDFLNLLLERAKINVRLYLTKTKKQIHLYDFEESKVMFKTEEETLNFVLNQCFLEENTRSKIEEDRLKDLNDRFTKIALC